MKYIFFGTPRFAEIVLARLIQAEMPPVAIVCNPDRPVGRKKVITKPLTKVLGERHHVEVFQPEKIDAVAIEHLRSLTPDFFVVAAYAKILPQSVLDVPRLGTIGVHPSLLPRYRGASPIQSAILGGEAETGTTLYLMDAKTDHGPILREQSLPIENGIPAFELPYLELEEKLAELGAAMVIATAPKFVAGEIQPREQDESLATYTKKFVTEDGFVNETDLTAAEQGDKEKASEILKKVNALNPEPGAWTLQNGKRIKLLKAELGETGRLLLLEIQKEGERRTSVGGN